MTRVTVELWLNSGGRPERRMCNPYDRHPIGGIPYVGNLRSHWQAGTLGGESSSLKTKGKAVILIAS
jgi:hypothetical protein